MNKDILDYLKVGVYENMILILREHYFVCSWSASPFVSFLDLPHLQVVSKLSECGCEGRGRGAGTAMALMQAAQWGCFLAADGALAWYDLEHLPPGSLGGKKPQDLLGSVGLPLMLVSWKTKMKSTDNK